MPANHHIDNANKLIITSWDGEANDNEFIEALRQYQQTLQNHPDYKDYNELLDLTGVTSFKLTPGGIKEISLIASASDLDASERKLALIVSSNLAYGLSRMYEAYRSFSSNSRKTIRVFKLENEAIEWLCG